MGLHYRALTQGKASKSKSINMYEVPTEPCPGDNIVRVRAQRMSLIPAFQCQTGQTGQHSQRQEAGSDFPSTGSWARPPLQSAPSKGTHE